jgi:hypothetical protein
VDGGGGGRGSGGGDPRNSAADSRRSLDALPPTLASAGAVSTPTAARRL